MFSWSLLTIDKCVVISVVWKMLSLPYIKFNTDDSLIDNMGACGGIFWDCRGSFLGCFASNLGSSSVIEAELHNFILGLKYAFQHGWYHVWVEGESTSALLTFINHILVPFRLRNQWHNWLHVGIHILPSRIYQERNACADNLADYGHVITNVVWRDSLLIFS